jgi:hypothetical protein
MNDPFQGVSRRGKRRTKEGDVQESS